MTDLLTQKNTKRVNFQPNKIRQTPPSCIFRVPPLGFKDRVEAVNLHLTGTVASGASNLRVNNIRFSNLDPNFNHYLEIHLRR